MPCVSSSHADIVIAVNRIAASHFNLQFDNLFKNFILFIFDLIDNLFLNQLLVECLVGVGKVVAGIPE